MFKSISNSCNYIRIRWQEINPQFSTLLHYVRDGAHSNTAPTFQPKPFLSSPCSRKPHPTSPFHTVKLPPKSSFQFLLRRRRAFCVSGTWEDTYELYYPTSTVCRKVLSAAGRSKLSARQRGKLNPSYDRYSAYRNRPDR